MDILQAYKIANDTAASSENLDAKIRAYDAVVNFCMNSRGCRLDDSTKRSMVMYWSYSNIGDAYARKNFEKSQYSFDMQNYIEALKYYNGALQVARDDTEKMGALSRMAMVYLSMGETEKWEITKEQIIDYMDESYKKRAYAELAEEVKDNSRSIVLLEKALGYVTKEEVSVFAKCQNTLAICENLLSRYRDEHDFVNMKRIQDLIDKTAILGVAALEERIHNTDDREQRLTLYVKLLEFEDKYMQFDRGYKVKIYQALANLLREDESLNIGGVKISRKSIAEIAKRS